MMENLKSKINLYLSGKMSKGEKQQFESVLSKYPALKAEIEEQAQVLRFEAYLNWEMEEESRLNFEADLERDRGLADEFRKYRNATNLLQDKSRKEGLAILQGLNHRQNVVRKIQVGAIAASVLFLICIGFYFFAIPKTISPQELAITKFSPAKFDLAYGIASSHKAEYKNAGKIYRSEKYSKAKIAFGAVPSSDKDYHSAQFYLANCLMVERNYEEAIKILQQTTLAEREDNKVNWFLALAYFSNGQKKEGYLTLNKITVSNIENVYREKANDFLRTVN